ncbi:hypothetical protein PSACC_02905 [Paramicrosporidium saccamoebae]|uniref:Cleavage/polyadenylation specificity factor A subunit C-terminal domain-containing protein n=1 Tax=Paramicrosporidium saccamoebae TaxID=1246581 RepID=A0A2H9THN3_9FUNG|nr:hypothetical protein PSACC_02905 [Paramicrosporidium saccamoebae]
MHGSIFELLPAGSIDHAVEARLTNSELSDLVIVRGSVLEVYTVQDGRLCLRSRHPMASRVLDVERVTGAEYDRLLLAFANAHFSVVEYCRELLEFTTVSLHSFTGETQDRLMERPTMALGERKLISIDGEGRCALLRILDGRFALLPMGRRSIVLGFSAIDERLRNVLDVRFLPGYLETTMAILYEPTITWPYRYPVRRDTVALLIVVVDLQKETPVFTKLASYEGLPSEVRSMWTPDPPLKGIFLPGANLLLHVEPGHPTVAGIALNAFATQTTKLPGLRKGPVYKTTFAGAVFVETDGKLLMTADNGELMQCQVQRDGGGRRIEVMPFNGTLVEGVINKVTKFAKDLLLIVPVLGDAVVLKRGTTSLEGNATMMDAAEDDIYGESLVEKTTLASHDNTVLGKIPCIAPISDFCVGGAVEDYEIVTCSAAGRTGQVNVFKKTLPLTRTTLFQISNCKTVFPLGDLFLVSAETSSLLLGQANGMMERIAGAIVDTEATVFACNTQFGVLQVTNSLVRLMTTDASMVIADLTINAFSAPISVQYCDSVVMIRHEDYSLSLYHLSAPGTLAELSTMTNILCADLYQDDNNIVLLAIIPRNSGCLRIIRLQDGEVLFENNLFPSLPAVLIRDVPLAQAMTNDIDAICFLDHGKLMCVNSRECGVILYRRMANSFVKLPPSQYAAMSLAEEVVLRRVRISSKECILVSNKSNSWIISLGLLNYPRIHPVRLSTKLVSISATDFGIYEQGGAYSRVVLDEAFEIDYECPFRRISFEDEAVKAIVYHEPSSTYSLISTKLTPFSLPKDDYAPISDNVDFVVPVDAFAPEGSAYSLKLLSSRAWKVIDEFALNEDEYGLCLASATLETKQTTSGRQPFVVLGTSINRGEDRPARGRIVIFDVIEIVPEVDRPETDRRYKLLADCEMKGPATAVCHMNGYLVVSIGAKIIVHSFEDNDSLTGVAFVDVGVYATNLVALKNFFAVGDICKSISFHAFQEKPPKVVTLARDYENCMVTALEYCVDGTTGRCCIVAADNLGNVHLLKYAPTSMESDGGMCLVFQGTFRTSESIVKMRRIATGNSHVCLLAGRSGHIRAILPLSETLTRRLHSLLLRLSASIPHGAGIHPRSLPASPLVNRPLGRTALVDATSVGVLRWLELPRMARGHLLATMGISSVNAALAEAINL